MGPTAINLQSFSAQDSSPALGVLILAGVLLAGVGLVTWQRRRAG